MDKYVGKRLDARYEVHELIGVGGMALVYKAYDVIEAKNVAIKILKDEYFGDKEFMRRFQNESKAISVLSHPNIVKVLNVSFGTNFQYMVMEFISGVTLKEYMASNGKINWHDALRIIEQVLGALSHAHSMGVIHRDIKPQNIMISDDGSIKVMDFGIARFFNSQTQTMTNRTIGSVHYISPEQAKGFPSNVCSDIYSVGVMLYEMLTNKLPFEADNAVSVAIMQMQVTPKPLRKIDPLIPQALEEITLKAMQKYQENRYSSASEMLKDICDFRNNNNIKFGYGSCFVDDSPTKVLSSGAVNIQDDKNDEEKEKKKKTLFVVGGITATLVIFSLAFMFITMFTSFGSSKNVDVPNFIGMNISDVENDKNYKFHFQIEKVYDPIRSEGVVLDQNPLANSKQVKSNATIILKVNSSGVLTSVPSVSGLTESEAKLKLSNAGFDFETIIIEDSSVPQGKVVRTDPSGESKAPAKSIVKLFVSKVVDKSSVKMPNIIGKTFADAKNELESLGLTVSSNVKYEKSDKEKDVVILCSPLPGVSTQSGSSVELTLSSGEKREKTLEVNVDLPSTGGDLNIKVYVDGELDNSKTTTVDSSYTFSKSFKFKGSQGVKEVRVKINDELYKVYKLDFDKSEVYAG